MPKKEKREKERKKRKKEKRKKKRRKDGAFSHTYTPHRPTHAKALG